MSAQPTRVVVIDDEPVVRQYLEVALREMGCTVEVFSTQQEGFARCQKVNFDVVFVDKNLPDGTGMRICELLEAKDCKVALITGYANLSSAVEAMRFGVAEYFIKPLDLEDLEARLRRMVYQLGLERKNKKLLAELREKNQVLQDLATRDTITGLFNHSHFHDRISCEIARSQQRSTWCVALVAIDRFSEVNQALGHGVGDVVLRRIGELLSNKNRPSSGNLVIGEQDLVARVGGDVYGVLLPDVPRSIAALKFRSFRANLKKTSVLDELPQQTASVGIAQYPDDATTPSGLIGAAQVALNSAKRAGGDTLICFRQEEHSARTRDIIDEVKRIHALGRSLANCLFRLEFQPIVDTTTFSPLAFETLCRPSDSAFADVQQLLETTERAGRFAELGQIVRQLAAAALPQLPDGCRLFINVHPEELEEEHLVSRQSPLHAHAKRVVFEITETRAIESYPETLNRLKELKSLGYGIALDDLGSGYSGLNSLAMLEPDFVKLDMALIRGIERGSRAARLARHISEFCADEGIIAIAEGVETQNELDVLREVGIRHMQGHLLARPSPSFEVPKRP